MDFTATTASRVLLDLTNVRPDVEHKLELKIGQFSVPADMDLGLFFDNVEAELVEFQ